VSIIGYDILWGHVLQVQKKVYQQTFTLNADIRYWPAFGDEDYQSSGAYIFRVENGTNSSVRYSAFQGMRVWVNNNVLSQATLTYFNEKNETANLILKVFKKRKVMEWILKLGSIPLSTQGKEVVLQFHTPDIDNEKTFWTDSEGLEMQKRILDYRPTWDFVGFLNVTQNYYPVNSAIAINDKKNGNQLTFMSTRA
jgi:lysosomal alpha-mannosidase